MKATQSTSTRTERRGITRFGKWLGLFALVLAAAALLLIALPAKSSVTMTTCGRWGLACRADAHQGVISLLALVIAIGAAIFAYLSLHGDKVARRVAQVQSRAAEKQAEKSYRGLLNLMLYETVHNLRHLAEEVRWVASVPEYEGCRLDGWPDLRFRYTERLLEVPHVQARSRAAGGHRLLGPCAAERTVDRPPCLFLERPRRGAALRMDDRTSLARPRLRRRQGAKRISNDARRFLTAVCLKTRSIRTRLKLTKVRKSKVRKSRFGIASASSCLRGAPMSDSATPLWPASRRAGRRRVSSKSSNANPILHHRLPRDQFCRLPLRSK